MSHRARLDRLVLSLAMATVAIVPAGCGGPAAGSAPTVPVKGTVTYKGKPLVRGTVTFEPDRGREAHGEIGPDGSFTLSTYGRDDGAVVGTHRVGIGGGETGPKSPIPKKFANVASSKVEVEVSAAKGDYPITLD